MHPLMVAALLGCHTKDTPPTDTSGGTTPTGTTGGTGGGPTGSTGSTGDTAGSTGGTADNPPSGFACSGNVVHYQADVEPIITSCGGSEFCHQLTLGRPGGAIPFLVGEPTDECDDHRLRVAPGDPEDSYLIDKLTDKGNCMGYAMPKPFSGSWTPLPDEQIQVVYDWICGGALDD